jgi:valyl-tRNA synthetase
MAFGTGAVKVTPAHDPNDNACGKRNNLETAIIFTGEGKMTDNCGQFAGASLVPLSPPLTSAARDDEVRRSYRHRGSPLGSGFASREGTEQDETRSLLEIRRHHRADDHSTVVLSLPPPQPSPLLTRGRYVDCNTMAANAVAAVRNGELKILPDFHEATWYRWLENIR